MDSSLASHSTVAQINRKSSIEAKVGGQAAVSGVIKSDMNAPSNSDNNGQQPIRTKAQYDNWL